MHANLVGLGHASQKILKNYTLRLNLGAFLMFYNPLAYTSSLYMHEGIRALSKYRARYDR